MTVLVATRRLNVMSSSPKNRADMSLLSANSQRQNADLYSYSISFFARCSASSVEVESQNEFWCRFIPPRASDPSIHAADALASRKAACPADRVPTGER